jgi:hypothetical protein
VILRGLWPFLRSGSSEPASSKARFAFPDDFSRAMKKLDERIVGRAGQQTLEVRHVDALSKIRSAAQPLWDAANALSPRGSLRATIQRFIAEWEKLGGQKGRFKLAGLPALCDWKDLRAERVPRKPTARPRPTFVVSGCNNLHSQLAMSPHHPSVVPWYHPLRRPMVAGLPMPPGLNSTRWSK